MSPNGAEKPIGKGPIESMKKTMKNDAKMDPNMEPKGAKNEPRPRQVPDTFPTPLQDAKKEPKWSQNGAKREPKGSPKQWKINKK